MKSWQFNILFGFAVLGAVALFVGPYVGLNVNPSLTQLSGYSAILAYVLGHRSSWIAKQVIRGKHSRDEEEKDGDAE